MNFIKLSTKEYPISESSIKDMYYPLTIPSPLTNEFLASIGYARVIDSTQDIPRKPWEYVEEKEPMLVGGQYIQNWQVVALSLAEKKSRMLGHFNNMFNQLIGQVKQTYPPTEVESWDKQEKEAREYLADNTAQASLVRSIADGRGVEVEWLSNKIVEKSDAYALYVGNLIGTRQLLEHQILNATEETIDSIVWPPED